MYCNNAAFQIVHNFNYAHNKKLTFFLSVVFIHDMYCDEYFEVQHLFMKEIVHYIYLYMETGP